MERESRRVDESTNRLSSYLFVPVYYECERSKRPLSFFFETANSSISLEPLEYITSIFNHSINIGI